MTRERDREERNANKVDPADSSFLKFINIIFFSIFIKFLFKLTTFWHFSLYIAYCKIEDTKRKRWNDIHAKKRVYLIRRRRSETLSLASLLASVWAENTPVIHALLVIYTWWLRLDFHSFVLLALVLRTQSVYIVAHWISFLHSAQKTCRSTIFHKMSGNKNRGGGKTMTTGRTDEIIFKRRSSFPPHPLLRSSTSSRLMESTNGRAAYMEESVVRAKCSRSLKLS